MKSDNKKTPEFYFDIRVRERLVGAGTLDAKVLEQHIQELPDLDAHAVTVDIDQPALAPRDNE